MYVIATAGHVDHGKSTLLRRLTGMEPDRLAEERRRGLTVDLGFVWTRVAGGRELAFVDVPGHARFVRTMLAGLGPVPAVLFVVAADEGWMPQSSEHLAALDALGVRHGLLAVTRCDLADAAPVLADARRRLAASTLGHVPAVAVSGLTGTGTEELRERLAGLVDGLPEPDTASDVRLWIDRCFTVTGVGTVVTGTLAAGSLTVGDELEVARAGTRVVVRGMETLGRPVDAVRAVARVAVNVRGVDRRRLRRGDALLTPRAWLSTGSCDVALRTAGGEAFPAEAVVHLGSAAVPARLRPLGVSAARLTLRTPLPLRVGDRVLLRDPGRHWVVGGADVLDVRPPPLRRRGAARARSEELAAPDPAEGTLRRYGFLAERDFAAMGLTPTGLALAGGWRGDPAHVEDLVRRLPREVEGWSRGHPLARGMPEDAACRALELPDRGLLPPLAQRAGLAERDGTVAFRGETDRLPEAVERSVARVLEDLRDEPYAAPDATRLAELGLRRTELAAAVRAGRLIRVADGVVLAADADERAVERLARLPQPFTLSQARTELRTTRRVVVPLLERLDRLGRTRKLPDGTHELRGGAPVTPDAGRARFG